MLPSFPFSAIVGQEPLKRALLLGVMQPTLGGVLVRGTKGVAKSTAVRALAGLLPPLPLVELPLGATEDRVLGSLHLEKALRGERALEPGLLAAADGGILYIDEVNLLPDHLIDVLLDAAASGVHRVEREGLSLSHTARFLLVGTMNPEEGELRPQLLDRFGLAVAVADLADAGERAEAVRRRLAYEADPAAFRAAWQAEEAAESERITLARQLLPTVRIP
jgi:Mg-chelatase subunit ChlI